MRSFLGRIGGFLASGALNVLRRKLDPRALGGGIFLGLDGVVMKSHGGSDALGFASALDMAIDMALEVRVRTELIPFREGMCCEGGAWATAAGAGWTQVRHSDPGTPDSRTGIRP